jgi:hypothetical protein
MAMGVLTDNRTMYNEGVAVYKTTVGDYLKWGRGASAGGGRVIGETSETLRDIYHTEFGLGSLVQAAETAWSQDEDLYGENGYALASALELHARIINAKLAGDEKMLPAGFKFFENMPKAPTGCVWKWSMDTQLWTSYNTSSATSVCSTLTDGNKYLLGISYLPTGFEVGYNHYVGRLGMKLPELAALLSQNPVDWYAFSWGLSTLTHADTAKDAWRKGLTQKALCPRNGRR